MRFTLKFLGDIPPNGKPEAKWEIGTQIHDQMKAIWSRQPLSEAKPQGFLTCDSKVGELGVGRRVDGIEFFPLVTQNLATVCRLDILLLSATDKNGFVVRGGDLDNRLKTLIDGLKAPTQRSEIPSSITSSQFPERNCLLDDDKLIVELRIRTDCLLDEPMHSNRALAIIGVHVEAKRVMMGTVGLF